MSLASTVRLLLRSTCLTGAALLLVTAAVSPAVAKKPEPFKGRVVATWDNIYKALPPPFPTSAPPATFTGTSQVTHLGRSDQSGTLTLQAPVPPGVFPGSGSVTITGANGDNLTFDFQGLLNPATGEGQGTFKFTGGTGRFANATGPGTFYAQIDLSVPTNQPMTVILDGGINY